MTSFLYSYSKPNSHVSSTRVLGLLLVPLIVVLFFVALFYGVRFDSYSSKILITMFAIVACLALGTVFLEHAIDRICRMLEVTKKFKNEDQDAGR